MRHLPSIYAVMYLTPHDEHVVEKFRGKHGMREAVHRQQELDSLGTISVIQHHTVEFPALTTPILNVAMRVSQ